METPAIKLMFLNEIQPRRDSACRRIFSICINFGNWNSYQIKALITLDYLFVFIFRSCGERENCWCRMESTREKKKNETPEPVRDAED